MCSIDEIVWDVVEVGWTRPEAAKSTWDKAALAAANANSKALNAIFCGVSPDEFHGMLGSKTLGLNVLELQFVMLANPDQNVLIFVLDLLKVCLYVKLESSILQDLLCKSAWLDRSKIRLDRLKLVQIVFSKEFSILTQAHLTCRVLCFVLSIKGKTLATF